ncbi:MAG: hypothetical protein QNK19_13715 [Xanthomonadales bacterium]|nr:hypothetical protein [Xanthomonadales bacterium]
MSLVSLADSLPDSSAGRSRLIVGVNGGGSKTAALVASVDETVLGCPTIARQKLSGTGAMNITGSG